MAFRKPARTGKWASKGKEAPVQHEAPVTWAQLLQEAVEKPGIISDAFRRFHSYSLGNAMLIGWQCAARKLDIGPVAAFGKWRELGRQVRKGEGAILICMPRPFTITEKDKVTGEETRKKLTKFVYRKVVFVYSQTDSIEGQEDKSSKLEAFPEDWSVEAAMRTIGVTFAPYHDTDGNCQGYFSPGARTIALNPVGEHPERTVLHELAHAELHPQGYDTARGICELEAEATAMLVGYSLGIGNADESRGYCQKWLSRTGTTEITERVASRVFAAANRILKAGRAAEQEEQEAA